LGRIILGQESLTKAWSRILDKNALSSFVAKFILGNKHEEKVLPTAYRRLHSIKPNSS
jgi:hypothetical protein